MIQEFGTTSRGENTKLYTLENKNGMKIGVSDYGATLVRVIVPDKNGHQTDIVLGYDSVKGYEEGGVFFGATVGRIANRIGKAEFKLNGKSYKLVSNDNQNNLHSGPDFYNKRMWDVKKADESEVVFEINSPHGDQGYPGEVAIQVTYKLTEANEVKITYHAVAQEDTIINMTNHSYFNLSGHSSGDILDQEISIDADAYTRADKESIPTGEIVAVKDTPMDFRVRKAVGKNIDDDYEALNFGCGYDHNWVLNHTGYRKIGSMYSNQTGINMEIYTDLPGIQVYSGNFLEKEAGKDGAVYRKRAGICFETQYFPDAVNKEDFEGPLIRKGETYDTITSYKFV